MEHVNHQMEEARMSLHQALTVTSEDKKRLANAVLQRVRTERAQKPKRIRTAAISTLATVGVLAGGLVLYEKSIGQQPSAETTSQVSGLSPHLEKPLLVIPNIKDTDTVEMWMTLTIFGAEAENYRDINTGSYHRIQYDGNGSTTENYYSFSDPTHYYEVRYNSHREVMERKLAKVPEGILEKGSVFQVLQEVQEAKLKSHPEAKTVILDGVEVFKYSTMISPQADEVEVSYVDPKTKLLLRTEVYRKGILNWSQRNLFKTFSSTAFPDDWFQVPKGTYHNPETGQQVEVQ